jgi:hypothetical protein
MTPDQLLDLVLTRMRDTGENSADAAENVAASLSGRDLDTIDPDEWTAVEDALWITMPWFVSANLEVMGTNPREDELRPVPAYRTGDDRIKLLPEPGSPTLEQAAKDIEANQQTLEQAAKDIADRYGLIVEVRNGQTTEDAIVEARRHLAAEEAMNEDS